ncbi:hypothetical protein AMATHDRAFT_77333 [Amanita thiersii Skay4041]|uniref:Protein SDA1 n=1 Tax=Amanita thiersii Skay4041 TaxID=703135 RepID=A0A2A9NHJ3_9AGAR|nr:hypothetical protein AMATHDRAFT_77333 [Amanita thiersii Skay4041]
MGRGVLLTANLPQLQNLIKRDPQSYKEEFLQQWNHYNSIRELFKVNPADRAGNLKELVTFISQVAVCYPHDTAGFPSQLASLLEDNYPLLCPETRKCLVQNLVILRKKDMMTSIELLKCLFPLLPRTASPSLRLFIRETILSDIRLANARTANHRLNRVVQAMLFGMVEHGSARSTTKNGKGKAQPLDKPGLSDSGDEAMWAIILAKELWKKGTWKDAKTVSIIALGCTHPIPKVQSASIHFFLGEETELEDNDEDEQKVDVKALKHRREINKKTRSGDKKLEKKLKNARKKRHKNSAQPNFPAIEMLHDPQTFGENLFDLLLHQEKQYPLEHKVIIMQLLSRVMNIHKTCVLNFYTYVIKYLFFRQVRVPMILAALAQSVHEMTPPDVLEPVIRKLAQEFVHPGVASQVIAAGINCIREISKRQPWAMDEDLLGDLIEYRKSKDKAVVSAARSLLQLYREVNPALLKRRERGKEASIKPAAPRPFGQSTEAVTIIEGLALLEDHLKTVHAEDGIDEDNDQAAWDNWVSDSSEDSESEGWINVDDGNSDLVISDSDDEEPDKEREIEATTGGDAIQAPSTLATTKILTPADFAILNELRLKAGSSSAVTTGVKRKLSSMEASGSNKKAMVTEDDILGPQRRPKADYEARMASVQRGREDREKFGSHKGKQMKAVPSSTTNKEKAKHKPVMMVLSSHAVRSKKKASLREKQRKLRAHISRHK